MRVEKIEIIIKGVNVLSSPLYLHYFDTREKREEKPHLLVGFLSRKGF
jgi:hypothetical protein